MKIRYVYWRRAYTCPASFIINFSMPIGWQEHVSFTKAKLENLYYKVYYNKKDDPSAIGEQVGELLNVIIEDNS